MSVVYNIIRPLITRGDIQNRDSVTDSSVVEEAVKLEKEKYSKTRIMRHFYDSLDVLLEQAVKEKKIGQIMDVGSATGDVIAHVATLKPDVSFLSIDIMKEAIEMARKTYSGIPNLSFEAKDFIHDRFENKPDLVMCLQTLEHIEDKYLESFADRIFNVAQKAVVVSVPREPIWCFANIARFKYWLRLGNSPHHIQHWTKGSFENFIMRAAAKEWSKNVRVISLSPLKLWTMLLLLNDNV